MKVKTNVWYHSVVVGSNYGGRTMTIPTSTLITADGRDVNERTEHNGDFHAGRNNVQCTQNNAIFNRNRLYYCL